MRARFRRIHLQYVSAQQQLGVTTLHLCMLAPIQCQALRGFIVTECKCRAWKKIYGHSYCTALRAIKKGLPTCWQRHNKAPVAANAAKAMICRRYYYRPGEHHVTRTTRSRDNACPNAVCLQRVLSVKNLGAAVRPVHTCLVVS